MAEVKHDKLTLEHDTTFGWGITQHIKSQRKKKHCEWILYKFFQISEN